MKIPNLISQHGQNHPDNRQWQKSYNALQPREYKGHPIRSILLYANELRG